MVNEQAKKFNAQNFRNALKYVPLPVIKNNNEKK